MNIPNNQSYYSGTSGLLLPVRNKAFYPDAFKDKSRLNYYASLFNSIEINSSFYKMPLASTVAKWANDVPVHFRFTFKFPKAVSHAKLLQYDPAIIPDFFDRIAQVGHKKGCVLIQFPGSIRLANLPAVVQLLADVAQCNRTHLWPICVEFRHPEWKAEITGELLTSSAMELVIHDKLPSGHAINHSSNKVVYLRFHGPNGNYRGSYPDDLLWEYAEYIKDWMAEGKTVYIYFNNTMGDAIQNLLTLQTAALGSPDE